jgi:hypothetical protein
MDLLVNDILEMKKPHPCGGTRFIVLRTGADLGIRCLKCNHYALVPRAKLERNIKKVLRDDTPRS